ncbi:hypothetical protein JTA33_24440 [Pseudomonas sp. 20GA0080]|uniref:hypothetical protein n=1 Tax=Pseudomonas alliivorans TaxID=2810613 RepID=UPI001AE47E4A|nr:hypothetical protein [Pseudomonas alliivorans]MBP0953599.1 hypothetical protein [Pseudomonas alliivorans]
MPPGAGRQFTVGDHQGGADYLLDVDSVYKRRLSNSKGGLISHIVDDTIILASVDFSYEVSVSRSAGEVLHFGQAKTELQPGGAIGQWQNLRTTTGVFTDKSNDGVENFYVDLLLRFLL